MKIVKASEFKAKCLALMDEVERTGDFIVITKNGREIAELRPRRPKLLKSAFGAHKGVLEIKGDIISPAADEDEWEALKDEDGQAVTK